MSLRAYEFISAARFCIPVSSPGDLDPSRPTRHVVNPAGTVEYRHPRYVFNDDDLVSPSLTSLESSISLRGHTAPHDETFVATLPNAWVEKYTRRPMEANTFTVFLDEGVALAESFHNRENGDNITRLLGECLPTVVDGRSIPVKFVDAEEPELTVDAPCLLLSSRFIHHNYYHWMIEALPRFWCRDVLPNFDELVLVLPDRNLRPFHTDILSRMNLPNKIIALNHRFTKFRELYFPSFLDPGTATRRQVTWLRDSLFGIFPSAPSGKPRRLLVSRRDARARLVSNENDLAARLAPLGFEVVVPGHMTPEEQISAFASAEIVVAPHGAGNTNIAFCRPGTPFIELIPAGYRSPHYWMLADVADLRYGRVVCAEDRPGTSMVADVGRVEEMTRAALRDL